MMKDGTMSVAETEEESVPVDEPNPVQEEDEENSPFEDMQNELHSKGTVLTKAWSDLFSFITKYQAELVVKENAVDIAEKEIEQRKKQLEAMKPGVDASGDEISQLQDEILVKERLLNKSQSQLSVQVRMVQRLQSDLSCNRDLLDQARGEILQRQNELVRSRGDLERLKSELTIKQDQIQIKDNLLKKLQSQLMKENTELKEQLDLERRALELERRSHELTKRTLLADTERRKRPRIESTKSSPVIEIPDSPPTLDLSADDDFGLSNIISLANTQGQNLPQPSADDFHLSSSLPSASPSSAHPTSTSQFQDTIISSQQWSSPSKFSQSPSKFSQSPSLTPSKTVMHSEQISDPSAMTPSETFFPLNVTEDVKRENMTMSFDDDSQSSFSAMKPSTPSSVASDSYQGPVPISGPIPSNQGPSSSSETGDGKIINLPDCMKPCKCPICGKVSSKKANLKVHMRIHERDKMFKCLFCGSGFNHKQSLSLHLVRAHDVPLE